MHTSATKLIRDWRALILLALVPALTNCSKIEGSVELHNSTGEAYSFEGAKVEAFDLNPAVVVPGGTPDFTKMPKGLGSVETDDGVITLQVITATIDDDALYDVEIRCPANATDACNVESPLHIVLNGAQLKAGDWNATALTEIAFQNIAYYVATTYSADDIAQILANNASALLLALPAGVQKTYEDLLAWSATETDAIKRVGLIGTISESLAAGMAAGDLKVLAQQAVSAELSSLNSDAYPFISGNFDWGTVIEGRAYLLGFGLAIIDVRDPNAIVPAAIFTQNIGGPLTASGDLVYAAGVGADFEQNTLFIFDIGEPQPVGQLEIPFGPSTISASGGYIYLGDADVLHIINATDPSAPAEVATLNIASDDLAAVGDHVYVSNATGVSIVDVSTPSAPLVVGNWATSRSPADVTLIGAYAYVTIPGAATSDPVQLQVVDISNPAAPTLATEFPLAPGTSGLTVVGSRAYADTSTTTQILDISNAAAPTLADSFPNALPSGIRVNDSAFLTFSFGNVSIVDPTIAAQPVVQSANLPTPGAVASLVASAGRYAYMPNRSEDLDVGFQVYDLIDPLAPELITTFDGAGFVTWIALGGNYAFSIDAQFGAVEVTDISNPLAPAYLGSSGSLDENHEEMFGIEKLVLSGNHVFVPWGYAAFDNGSGVGYWGCTNTNVNGDVGGLFAVDVSTPATPVLASHICMPEKASTVAVNGNYAYVGVADGTLRVVDFTDPTAPALTGSVDLAASANSTALVNGYLWVTEGDAGIEVFNISNPATPVLLTRIAVPGNNTSIEAEGNYAYVAAGLSGVHIFDIGNPMLPHLVGSVSTDLPARSVFVESDHLYAATNAGLEIFKAYPGSL